MPRDLFAETQNTNQPRDLFAESGVQPDKSLLDKYLIDPSITMGGAAASTLYGIGKGAGEMALSLPNLALRAMGKSPMQIPALSQSPYAPPEQFPTLAEMAELPGSIAGIMTTGGLFGVPGLAGRGASALVDATELPTLAKVLNLGAQGGVYGAANAAADPDSNILAQAGLGVGLGAGAGTIAEPLSRLASKTPELWQQLKSGFSSGKNVDKIKSLLTPESIGSIENEGSVPYESVKNVIGKNQILTTEISDALGGNQIPKQNSAYYRAIADDDTITKGFAKKAHNNFESDPTFNNAHSLKKVFSDRIIELNDKALKEGGLGENDKLALQSYQDAKAGITKDMMDYANNVDPVLGETFKSADRNWAVNVEPWREAAYALRNLGEDATDAQIAKRFSKIKSTTTPISSNAPTQQSKLPSELLPTLKDLSNSIKNKQLLKNAAIGTGALGGLGITLKKLGLL